MIRGSVARRKWSRNARNEAIAAALFLLPSFVGLLALTVVPIVASLWISFQEWDLLKPPTFIGLANYQEMIGDEEAWRALRITLVYLMGAVPLGILGSLSLAVALNTTIRGIGLYRTVYFIPVVSSTIAVGLMFRWIYNTEFGLLNHILESVFDALHLPFAGPPWLQDPAWAMPAIIMMSVWKGLGYNMVILLAGLKGIPDDFYEAAMIDGAGGWKRFRHITLPLLTPALFFVVVVSMIGSFQVFDQAYIMTRGGPARSTVTIVYYLYENAFQWGNMGYAASIGWILFLLIFSVTVFQWIMQRKWVFYR